jgi:hypothetical protein
VQLGLWASGQRWHAPNSNVAQADVDGKCIEVALRRFLEPKDWDGARAGDRELQRTGGAVHDVNEM